MTTNITEDHRRAFEALTGGEAGNFCLFSCFLSGRPAAAIAAMTVCPPRDVKRLSISTPDRRAKLTPLSGTRRLS